MSVQFSRQFQPLRKRWDSVQAELEQPTSNVSEQAEVFRDYFAKKYPGASIENLYAPQNPDAKAEAVKLLESDFREATGIKDPQAWLERTSSLAREAEELQGVVESRFRDAMARGEADPRLRSILQRLPQTDAVKAAVQEAFYRAVLDDDTNRPIEAIALAIHDTEPGVFTADDSDSELLWGAQRERQRLDDEAAAERRRKYSEADGDENDKAMAAISKEWSEGSGIVEEKVGSDTFTTQDTPEPLTPSVKSMLKDLRDSGVDRLDNGTPLSDIK